MKNRAVTLLLCLMLAALSILRAFPASAEGIAPATAADFDLPCAAAILLDEDSGTMLSLSVNTPTIWAAARFGWSRGNR